jgi:hypothetical protein
MSFTTGRYTVVPPIPLQKEAEKPEQKGEFFKTKIYPGERNDATKAHDISIHHFSSGTTEEWIKDYTAFMRVCDWQKTENLFTLARVFLKGDALSKFNAICLQENIAFNNNDQESKANFKTVIGKLSVLLMPRDSLSTQKEYMVYYCRKPTDTKFRAYVTRLCEMNEHLTHFPPNFCDDQKFSKQQLIDIVNFGMPPKWKVKLSTDFGTISKENITLELLMDFGERQEIQESYLNSGIVNSSTISRTIPRKAGSTYKKTYTPGSLTKTGYASKPNYQKTDQKWCPYHKTNSHGINECVVVRKLAESASQSRDSKTTVSPMKFDKKNYQTFIMYTKWLENNKSNMMLMEAENEEPMIEEGQELDESNETIENNEDIDLDNLSLSDLPDEE